MNEVFENNNQLHVYFNRYYDNYPFFHRVMFQFFMF